jgi:hypothetical protein
MKTVLLHVYAGQIEGLIFLVAQLSCHGYYCNKVCPTIFYTILFKSIQHGVFIKWLYVGQVNPTRLVYQTG